MRAAQVAVSALVGMTLAAVVIGVVTTADHSDGPGWAETPAAAVAPAEIPYQTDDDVLEPSAADVFVADWRAIVPRDTSSDAEILGAAQVVCDHFAEGTDFTTELVWVASNGPTMDEAAQLIGITIGAVCPEYASVLGY